MKSLWQDNFNLKSYPELSGNISTDVLVVGSGLSGLLTAYLLNKRGVDCVLVDKGRICSQTTAHSTAKITAQHGLIYRKILKSYGKEYARMYYDANIEAVGRLKSLCYEAGCSFEEKSNFVYSYNMSKLSEEAKALESINVPYVYSEILPLPLTAAGAIGFENQAQFNPLELARFLSKGLKIYENTWVRELVGTKALTDKGEIKAKKVVVATHFPFINKHGSYFLKLYQHRSYILALSGAEKLADMYVDDDKKGMSLSSFEKYLLLGGGGHRTGKKGGSFNELRAFKEAHYGNAQECFTWAAQDTMSLDSIPYIGNYSRNTPDLYVCAGFNKWGMTSSMVSAEIISSEILGEKKDYSPVFSPSRSILKPQILINGFESAKNLLLPTVKRCPHLGCALKYNKAEHSWDCACHGSRFSENGKVLNGPANGDMKMN
ncbi:MAG: FAD-dependent oxidoreductase [Clostridia bacterium]|nr:FAD-dependent oxidoreductase [Clostridia bacterium]